MKKALLMTLVFVAMTIVVKSQPGQMPTPEQRVQNLMAEVKKQMTLPEEKLVQVEKLYTGYYKEMAEIRQASQGSFDREKMQEHRQKFSEKLLEVLTQAEHDELVEIERSQRRQRRSNNQ